MYRCEEGNQANYEHCSYDANNNTLGCTVLTSSNHLSGTGLSHCNKGSTETNHWVNF